MLLEMKIPNLTFVIMLHTPNPMPNANISVMLFLLLQGQVDCQLPNNSNMKWSIYPARIHKDSMASAFQILIL